MVLDRNFVLPEDIKECMLTLQSKKCEGFDQIPLCVITDARDILLDPMADLFSKIYLSGVICVIVPPVSGTANQKDMSPRRVSQLGVLLVFS